MVNYFNDLRGEENSLENAVIEGSFLRPRPELIKIINPGHEMEILTSVMDWDRLDELYGVTYCPKKGSPGISTRLMVSLHYLKYTFNISDEDTVAGWVENQYYQ